MAAWAAWETPARAGKGNAAVTTETVEYRGWKNNLKVSNGDAELIVTLDVGPRVISYRLTGGANVFKNYDAMMGTSGEPNWMIRGGHRLWTAPEDTTRTYAPDNAPVRNEVLGPGHVRFTQPDDAAFGIRKEIELTLGPSGSKVTVLHRVTNVGSQPTDLSVWALSVMAPGGVEVIPMPPRRPHPGDVKNAKSAADFAPSLRLSLWPFTDLRDPRWYFGEKFITLRQDAHRGATKLGLAYKLGAVGYLNSGTLFVKRFGFAEGKHYPDNGVNYETFANEDMLEMESLSPLVRLEPGASAEHVEHWELFSGLGTAATEAELEAKVAPRLK
jgi:hypothetical protein